MHRQHPKSPPTALESGIGACRRYRCTRSCDYRVGVVTAEFELLKRPTSGSPRKFGSKVPEKSWGKVRAELLQQNGPLLIYMAIMLICHHLCV
ncbi:hypothetical protein BS47DRAFT_779911 [Hydnum rufescens UP504]|uniref:Uncharacterized protein n=1 Tax=Hydnum rufescens UP504 TaxID=1448309 RepID=A0A9P6DYA7_9AGAM|nr:hypothetical protein BS47DRAFT_779911 [Hydnum rufescens UP504]